MVSSRVLKHNAMEGRFYRFTEPFFNGMINVYRKWITGFLKRRYWALVIIVASALLIALFWTMLPSEMAPLEDRGYVNISARATEGTSYEYMTGYMETISPVVEAEVPESDNIMMMVGMLIVAKGFAVMNKLQSSGNINVYDAIGFDRIQPVRRRADHRTGH